MVRYPRLLPHDSARPFPGNPGVLACQDRQRCLWAAWRSVRIVVRVALLVAPKQAEGGDMPIYLVERIFLQGLSVPINDEGMKGGEGVVDVNHTEGVGCTRT